jgi:hypothetical protein
MYLYRFDQLDCLKEQSDDPVLRAKRVKQAKGVFDHFQVINELPSLAHGHGAYRFCFWKTWEAAVRQFPRLDDTRPWLMQRIRADHPVLEQFSRDDDEYLLDDAWIYWQTAPLSEQTPDWSPAGIPHTDIEVLNPQGFWEPLATTAMLGDPDLAAWDCVIQAGMNGTPCPTYVRSIVRSSGGDTSAWVLIRQKAGPWTSVLNDKRLVAGTIAHCFPQLAHLNPSSTRWALALECDDRVLASEIFPSFSPAWRPGILVRLFGGGTDDVNVHLDDRMYRAIDNTELRKMYVDFGIAEVLRLQKRYAYPADFLENLQSQKDSQRSCHTTA